MPNEYELNFMGSTTGTYATTTATYGTRHNSFFSVEEMKKYLEAFETGRHHSAVWYDEFITYPDCKIEYKIEVIEEDEGAWTTP